MKVLFKNTGYFLKEIKTIIKLDFLSNLFSLLSLSFIFFLLALILSGGWISNYMIEAMEDEAEISVYYSEGVTSASISNIIKAIDGVKRVKEIDELEAKTRMIQIMGEESRIIELFNHNPFSPYIEVKIDLDKIDLISNDLKSIDGVELVRDNKEVLLKLKNISKLSNILGLLVIVAVGISTLVITYHIIRQGIYINKQQINTLRLLGAPEIFITLPFILEGLILTILSSLISIGIVAIVLSYIYSQVTGYLPFLVLPKLIKLISGIGIIGLSLSIILGLLGSYFGLRSTREY